MYKFLDFLIPFLKFTAIFISGVSGILALLVDFKVKGKITKWGRIALISTVVSFLISAIMQAIEIHKDNEATAAEIRKTQTILNGISRDLYQINQNDISFDIGVSIDLNDKFFDKFNSRILKEINKYQTHPNMKLPKGTEKFTNTDRNVISLIGFNFDSTSPLYPNKETEPELYNLIGQISLDITIKKYDTVKGLLVSKPSLAFITEFAKPEISYNSMTNSIYISADYLKADVESFNSSNSGDIASLLDLSKAELTFMYSDAQMDNLSADALHVLKKRFTFQEFRLNVANRKFGYYTFCQKTYRNDFGSYFSLYILRLPSEVVSTNLDLDCNGKSRN